MRLGEPLTLRGRTLRNRVLFGPHETNLARPADGRGISDRHVAYYRRRAEGGAGMVVVETASVHPSDWPYERAPLAADCAAGWARVATAVRAAGGLAVAGLGHAGGQGSSANSQLPLWAPSGVPDPASREVPKAMEPEDVTAVIDGFAAAARSAVAAGLDGVEVNAGQYSLVRQFLSGLTNQRGDAYGSDRVRFAREVLAAVRGAAPAAVVGLRLSCDELFPWGGLLPEQGAEIAAALAEHVDYLVVVRGSHYGTSATRPDGHTPPGFNLELTSRVRAAADPRVAVVAQGSIVDVAMAEEALASGVCDAVEMTRAQIADPDLTRKALAGTPDRIRPCILCNQACQVRDARNPIVSCVGEPSAGHETNDDPVEGIAAATTDVLVIGGGPAGLETARVAALRGHQVRLVERSARLGGMVPAAAAGPGRERLALLTGWLEHECRTLGVQIETDREATAEDLTSGALAADPGTVVLCTGSRPGALPFPAGDGAVVRTAAAVLDAAAGGDVGEVLPDGPVAVWDPVGGPVAVSVAELLAPDRQVTLLTEDVLVGRELARGGDLSPANVRLHQAGVRLAKRSKVVGVDAGKLETEDVFSGERTVIEAAAVVDCGHRLPDDRIWRRTGGALVRAGDAVAPRTIYEAVLEGRRAALALGTPHAVRPRSGQAVRPRSGQIGGSGPAAPPPEPPPGHDVAPSAAAHERGTGGQGMRPGGGAP